MSSKVVKELWLVKELKEIKRLQAVTIDKINELSGPQSKVIPELEQQVKRSMELAHSIDQKVED